MNKDKVCMTYDQYDKMEENLENFKPETVKPAYPTMREVDHYIRPNLQKYLKYITWLLKQEVELSEEEKKVQKELRNILYENLTLYDPEEEL